MKKKIRRIRTGGQSGIDRAAMDFAREQRIPTCGWCPRGGWAEDYPDPPGVLLDYPELTETPSEDTAQRTKWNMRDCDAILTIIPRGSVQSPGTQIGLDEGKVLNKPMFTASGIEDAPDIIRWINSLPDGTELCIGGPRASECENAYSVARTLLSRIAEGMKGLGMTFRTAELNEIETLIEIRKRQLLDEGQEPNENMDESLRRFFHEKMRSGELVEWVAVDTDGKIIATAAILFMDFPPAFDNPAGIRGYITNMYTDDRFRGQGIAGVLLKKLEQEAEDRGVRKLTLHASALGRKAYIKSGYCETDVLMEKVL